MARKNLQKITGIDTTPVSKRLKRNTAADRTDRTTSSAIPFDVIEIIMSKLPVKCLIRFRSVCKSWKATISDPRFSKILNIRQSNSRNLFLLQKKRGSFCFITLGDKIPRVQSDLGKPLTESSLLCSCNGIVLLRGATFNDYVLWNPSIRKHAAINYPHDQSMDRTTTFDCGLYYDSRDDDYKVVFIFQNCYTLFSCKSRTWSEKICLHKQISPLSGVFVDGSFYYCWYGVIGSSREGILRFDVVNDKWETLKEPNGMKLEYNIKLIALSGRLCLYIRGYHNAFIQLWVMEKHSCSWRELMNIDTEKMNELLYYRIVCLTEEDNVVLHLKGSKIVVYNTSEKRFEESRKFYGMFNSKLIQYTETLDFPI